ncbi:MAG: hypothetical protein HYS27_05990 [Deltaproteobacteria bacterium]|nr:hypothetical protein [Deltaproteobacteria bacterium]
MSATLPLRCRVCDAETDGSAAPIACPSCGALLPVHARVSPFALLGVARPRFALGRDELERAWLTRSRRVHPDRFAAKSEAERRCAAEQVAALNDAKRALFEPYDRALWLVQQASVTPPQLAQQALVELMEQRERAEEDAAARASIVDDARARFRARLEELGRTLAPLDEADDGYTAPSPPLRRAAALLAELKTLARLVDDLGGGKLIGTLDAR